MQNFLDPAILFFVFGLVAGTLRSNLEIPPAIARFLSLYLLMSLGLKGGFALAKSGLTADVVVSLTCAMALAVVVPAIGYALLVRRLSRFDAAAIAATYGSVSAVTFITAVGFAERHGLAFGGYMAVALVLMETPAIIMAVVLANIVRSQAARQADDAPVAPTSVGKILHEAFTDGAQMLLLGSLLIGFVTGADGKKMLDPFIGQIQKGILAFFLLDMGLLVARRARDLRANGAFLSAFGILVPLFNAALAAMFSRLFGLGLGDAFLLSVLGASASYIVVPAVLRYAIPEANAGLYFGMSLVITFPFNIAIGIPLYFTVLSALWA